MCYNFLKDSRAKKLMPVKPTDKITLEQDQPRSWTRINVLVGGVTQYVAVQTVGPGVWQVFKVGQAVSIGCASSKTEIKQIVKKQLNS